MTAREDECDIVLCWCQRGRPWLIREGMIPARHTPLYPVPRFEPAPLPPPWERAMEWSSP